MHAAFGANVFAEYQQAWIARELCIEIGDGATVNDLKERLAPDPAPLDVEVRERFNPLVLAIRLLDKPVIAAVNGVAAGAGASLAFACDLRIAAEHASFVLAFGRIGLVPDTGATWLLPRLVGLGRASELLLLADPLPAAEALRIGLVNRVVAPDDVLDEAVAWAGELARGAIVAHGLAKAAVDRGLEGSLAEGLGLEQEAFAAVARTEDAARGLASFAEHGPGRATFVGR